MSPRDLAACVTGCGGPGCASRSGRPRPRGRQAGFCRSAGRQRPAQALPPPIHVQQGLGLAEDQSPSTDRDMTWEVSPGHHLGRSQSPVRPSCR